MTTSLTIKTDRRDGGPLTLAASGEIDLSNVEVFSRGLQDAISDSGGGPVTVDLSAVEYLDSGAINILFNHADNIHVVVRPLLIPVLTISGLTELTTVEAVPRGSRP
jgi:anti-anti-sigma factor